MKRFYLIFYSCLLFVSLNNAYAQVPVFQIKGGVYTDSKLNYESTTIQLLKSDQKTIAKLELVDTSGMFIMSKIPAGAYYLKVSGPNIEDYLSDKIELNNDIDLGRLKLIARSTNLKEVSISASKPLIQQFFDKTVVNVSGSITAVGSTALDVLAKSPGVTVDKDDNIAMRGRLGVLVMIDGKLVPMSGPDLANMLRNMSSNQVDKIDLITNPSAKYDASGNSGIIDIHLKKDTRVGTNGSIAGSYGQGRYAKFNSGISLNNRTGKLNVFGSYNYGDRNIFNDVNIGRTFYNQNNLQTSGYNEVSDLQAGSISHNVRFGADYYITPKTIIGFVGNGLYYNAHSLINDHTDVLDNNGRDTSSFITGAHNYAKRNYNSINLNFKSSLDTSGKELTADLDYANYQRNDLQNYLTRYYNLQNVEDQTPYALFGDLNGNLSIKSVKTDYSQRLGKKARLELGLKSSWVAANNNVAYFNQSGGGNILDTTKSNHFIYNENINAAYVNTSGKWGKTSLQFGLRLENTIAKGLQLIDNSSFDRNYTQLFPSGYFGYNSDKNDNLGISYSRRINRPTYSQLNPFKIFLDPTLYSEGNPFLKPEITDSYELSWTYKQTYLLKIGYSSTNNNIINILLPDAVNSTNVVQEPQNIDLYRYYDLSISIPFSIGKWFSSSNNMVFYYGKYDGELAGTVLNNGKVAFNINNDNIIQISKNWTGEIAAIYQSGDVQSFQNLKSYGTLDMGISTKLFNNQASLKLNVSDLFLTYNLRSTTQVTGYKETYSQHNDTRVATLSFTYRFGNSKVPAARRKTSGAEDEKRRAQS